MNQQQDSMRHNRYFQTKHNLCLIAGIALAVGCLAQPLVAGEQEPAKSVGIGLRYDATGFFPAAAKPPVDFDGVAGKNLLWKKPLPNFSNSSPIVIQDKVFVLVDHGWPLGDGDAPRLLCYHAGTGELLWSRSIDPFDAVPAEEAKPLKAARHAFWTHQHALAQLFYRYMFEENSPAEEEAILAQAREHGPAKGHNDPVKKSFVKGNKSPKLMWDGAMNHPDTEPLWQRRGQPLKFGRCCWGWTGVGMTMCTPISDGESVYVVTGLRTVTKFDLDGNILWHVWEKDTELTSYYECWLANALLILPVEIEGQSKRLLVFEFLNHLWAYDCATGKLVWKTPTSGSGGHVCGTPQLLRLKRADGGEELIITARSGDFVRARDGEKLLKGIYTVSYSGPISDGRDLVWFQQVGGDGGHFTAQEGSHFPKKCIGLLRFKLDGEQLVYDKVLYDEFERRPDGPTWPNDRGYFRDGVLVDDRDLRRIDGMTRKELSEPVRGFGTYHASILAGGHFYGIPKMTTLAGAPKGTKPGSPDVDVRVVCSVAADGEPIKSLGERDIEIIEANPKDPAERNKRIALTGRVYPAEWYWWHGAYSVPFAYQDRLYIRTFNNLYCFGEKKK